MIKEELYRWLRLDRPTEESGAAFPPGYCHFPALRRRVFQATDGGAIGDACGEGIQAAGMAEDAGTERGVGLPGVCASSGGRIWNGSLSGGFVASSGAQPGEGGGPCQPTATQPVATARTTSPAVPLGRSNSDQQLVQAMVKDGCVSCRHRARCCSCRRLLKS